MSQQKSRWRHGFTLIETLIAMIILSGAVIIISNAWSGNFVRVRKSAMIQEVSHLLERKMTELELKYRSAPQNLPEEDEGNFGDDFPKYTWKMKSKEFEMPDISGLLVAQKGGANEMLLQVVNQTQEFMRKAIKEVKLTVIAKIGAKEVAYSIATYFVDYDKEFVLPGIPGGGGSQDSSGSGSQSSGSGSNSSSQPSTGTKQ